jgi:sulfur carrier protein
MSKIKVNNELQEVTLPLSLSELIKQNKVFQPEMVSIQINGEFVNHKNFDTIVLSEGDEVDFLYFMGGGQK